MFRRTLVPVATVLVSSLVAAGCGGSMSLGGGSPGLAKDDLLANGEKSCPYTKQLRTALKSQGMPTELTPQEQFDAVITHDDSQDEADSADSTILHDTGGASLLCRYDLPDDVQIEVHFVALGTKQGRDHFLDAEAWQHLVGYPRSDGTEEYTADQQRLGDAEIGEPVLIPTYPIVPQEAAVQVRGEDGGSAALSVTVTPDHVKGAADAFTDAKMLGIAKSLAAQLGK